MKRMSILTASLNGATYCAPHNTFYSSTIANHKYFNARLKSHTVSWVIHFIFNKACQALSLYCVYEFKLLKTGGIRHG